MKDNRKSFFREGHLLIGVSGSINASYVPGYLTYLRKEVCQNIKVIITKSASTFLEERAIEYITGSPIYADGKIDYEFKAAHISLTRWADAFLILPATANIISKSAHGIADDLLSTAIFCAKSPVIYYPGMNIEMWNNPILKENVEKLKSHGYHFRENKEKGLEIADGVTTTVVTANILKIKNDLMEISPDFSFRNT